jgi:dihydroorotase
MPNLIPPLTTPDQTVDYISQLRRVCGQQELVFLPSMYLNSNLTPELIREAKQKGIVGIKSYPRGVTTNSEGGVGMEGYAVYDKVFEEMEKQDLVLNLHGEVPSDVDGQDGNGTCVLNAEERFIPHLLEIHRKFPKLRIVLEHCTTSAAVEAVKSLPSNVVATITPHHLHLTIDSACSTSLGFCKPLAKFPSDRKSLREIIKSGNRKFFLGSDSAPHPSSSKLPALQVVQIEEDDDEGVKTTKQEISLPSPCAAGIYTSANLIPLTAEIFERSQIPLDKLQGFVSDFGRDFYKVPAKEGEEIVIRRTSDRVVEKVWGYDKDDGKGKEYVIPFLAGEKIGWEIVN